MPTIEVRFEHLKVDAEAYVGSSALPTFLNFATNMIEVNLVIHHLLFRYMKHIIVLDYLYLQACNGCFDLTCLFPRSSFFSFTFSKGALEQSSHTSKQKEEY